MIKAGFCLSLIFSCFAAVFAADSIAWKEEKSVHFIVYYTGNRSDFAKEVLYQAEKNYVRIADYFGYSRNSNFWTWENRVKIFIYPDSSVYMKATQMPSWSKGMANYTQKYIATYVDSETFIEDILPHEMAHLIFRDFVGFRGEVPLWLDEGVAQWAELNKRQYIQDQMRQYQKEHLVFSLKDMMQIDIRKVSGDNKLIRLYYTQAASLVAFLIERFGIEPFAVFCRSLRDGSTLEEALKSAYPGRFSNIGQLQQAWLEYIEQRKTSGVR